MPKQLQRRIASVVLALTIACTIGTAALAMGVQPLLVDIEPGRSGSIRVENNRTHPLTVEVTLWRRSVSESGEQTRIPADDDFVVLPPQLVIQPGRVQVVRLQWVGQETPEQSLSYYANLREVPIALEPTEGAQLQVAFAFDVAVQVSPPGARADLSLVDAQVATGREGSRVARLLIENRGTRYAYLQNARYELEVLDASGSVIERPSFTHDQLTEILGVTLLEPGKRRIADLPLSAASNAASIRGRIRAGDS